MNKDKKIIQKKRMIKYFIDAVQSIIEAEGIDFVTIRKVSDIAGFNSATIYNYFGNLNELIFFSSIKYLEEYIHNLPSYLENCDNSLDKFIAVWKCFCHYSYRNPKIYYHLFFEEKVNTSNNLMKDYFSIFSEEVTNQSEDLIPMLLGEGIYDRNLSVLENCVSEGFFKKEDLPYLNEMIILIYQSMLYKILKNQCKYSIEEACERTLIYIKRTISTYTLH